MFPLLSQLFIDKLCFPSGSFFISAKISQDSMGRYSEEVHVSLEAMVHLGEKKKTPQGQQNMHLFRTFLSSHFFSVLYSRPALVSLKDCVMFFFSCFDHELHHLLESEMNNNWSCRDTHTYTCLLNKHLETLDAHRVVVIFQTCQKLLG